MRAIMCQIYVVQFPLPRFFLGIYVRYTHVAIASVFKKVELSSTFFAAVCGYATIYPIILLDFVTYHLPCGKPFCFKSPSIYMEKHSDVEALLIESPNISSSNL